ncbi:MAG: AAA family ATPase [Syntrophomonadaceae bacterium]|nr:AAA family ATPase [Syntrophomonadaceae bacterium]
MGKAIAIANQKGGVGKTTTAVNLGTSLAQLGKRVLVVDIDPQGNATSGLGADRQSIEHCIYDVLVNGVGLEEVMLETAVKNLLLIPATLQLAGAEIELVSAIAREGKLRRALEKVKEAFDYLLIDCPPSLGLLTVNALTAADRLLIPIQCEYYALEGLGQLMHTVSLVRRHLNNDLDLEGVLLTMFDARTNLSIQVAEEVKRYFKDRVFKSVVPRNVRLSEAPSHGQPVLLYDPKSKGAEVYLELAKEVLENG